MNVVVVAAHGLGCHWLGPYGNPWVSTRAIDLLASESVVFDQHFADEPSPAGSRLGCPATVLQSLQANRITTALVDDRKVRLNDDRPWTLVVPSEPEKHSTPGDALGNSLEIAIDRLASTAPWLLWIETELLVPPWDLEFETYQEYAATSGGFTDDVEMMAEPTDNPPSGKFAPDDDRHWHQLRNSFAAAVTAFDGELARVIEIFRKRGLEDSTTWILTSGYGWPLGEHGIVGLDGSRMHEEMVHIPLIVRLPIDRRETRRVSAFTQASDLGPTLSDLFGIPTTGPSLQPLMTGAKVGWRDSARTYIGGELMLRTDDWAYLQGHSRRLYRKPDDIWEVNDIAGTHPDECDRLSAILTQESPS